MKKFTYIIALFAGRVELDSFVNYFDNLVQMHLKAIEKFDQNSVSKVVLVINSDSPEMLSKALSSANLFEDSFIPVQVLVRENLGYSYGAWEFGVLCNLQEDVDGYFLIEDDYLPSSQDFLNYFSDKLTPNVGFVAQTIEALTGTAPLHAAVSNGLLSKNAVVVTLEKFNRLFAIFPFELKREDHLMGTENQVTFLAFIQEAGFVMDEIAEECSVPFHETYNNEIRERGNQHGPAPISPISMLK